jgi:hypothetical protein
MSENVETDPIASLAGEYAAIAARLGELGVVDRELRLAIAKDSGDVSQQMAPVDMAKNAVGKAAMQSSVHEVELLAVRPAYGKIIDATEIRVPAPTLEPFVTFTILSDNRVAFWGIEEDITGPRLYFLNRLLEREEPARSADLKGRDYVGNNSWLMINRVIQQLQETLKAPGQKSLITDLYENRKRVHLYAFARNVQIEDVRGLAVDDSSGSPASTKELPERSERESLQIIAITNDKIALPIVQGTVEAQPEKVPSEPERVDAETVQLYRNVLGAATNHNRLAADSPLSLAALEQAVSREVPASMSTVSAILLIARVARALAIPLPIAEGSSDEQIEQERVRVITDVHDRLLMARRTTDPALHISQADLLLIGLRLSLPPDLPVFADAVSGTGESQRHYRDLYPLARQQRQGAKSLARLLKQDPESLEAKYLGATTKLQRLPSA